MKASAEDMENHSLMNWAKIRHEATKNTKKGNERRNAEKQSNREKQPLSPCTRKLAPESQGCGERGLLSPL